MSLSPNLPRPSPPSNPIYTLPARAYLNLTQPTNQLGLLKPSRAEHELFIRATNLIETTLTRAANELKHDKYLGDADWNVVFRWVLFRVAVL